MEAQTAMIMVLGAAALVCVLGLAWWVGAYNALVHDWTKVKEALTVLDKQIEQYNNMLKTLEDSTTIGDLSERTLHKDICDRREALALLRSGHGASTPPVELDDVDDDQKALFLHASQLSKAARYIVESAPLAQAPALYANAQKVLAQFAENVVAAERMLAAAIEQQRQGIKSFPQCLVASVHAFTALPSPDHRGHVRTQRVGWH